MACKHTHRVPLEKIFTRCVKCGSIIPKKPISQVKNWEEAERLILAAKELQSAEDRRDPSFV